MGILLQLYLKNLITCGCYCGNSEDKNAYQAIRYIQKSCRYIVQYPTSNDNGSCSNSTSSGGTGNFFMTTLFGSNSSSNKKTQQSLTQPRRVRLLVQDSDIDGQPILCIIPYDDNVSTSTTGNNTTSTDTSTIKLRKIDKVQLDGDQIVLYNKTLVELLRFTILIDQKDPSILESNDENNSNYNNSSNNTNTDFVLVSTDTRNMMVHYWMVLVEWERQRRKKLKQQQSNSTATTTTASSRCNSTGNDDDDDDSDTEDDNTTSTNNNNNNNNNTNFITRHAQKLQHYAQREIELQHMKQLREQRKIQLLSQTNGGLKYTAMAMAAQQQQQQQQQNTSL